MIFFLQLVYIYIYIYTTCIDVYIQHIFKLFNVNIIHTLKINKYIN